MLRFLEVSDFDLKQGFMRATLSVTKGEVETNSRLLYIMWKDTVTENSTNVLSSLQRNK